MLATRYMSSRASKSMLLVPPSSVRINIILRTNCALSDNMYSILDGFNTTIVNFDSSDSSAQIPYDFAGQGYIVLTNAVQGQELNDDK
jgi:hypothetical protein